MRTLPHNDAMEIEWLRFCLDNPTEKMSHIHLPNGAFFNRQNKIIHFAMSISGSINPTRDLVSEVLSSRSVSCFFSVTDRNTEDRQESSFMSEFVGDIDEYSPPADACYHFSEEISNRNFFAITDELLFLYAKRLQKINKKGKQ
jgi:hypothetical protein